MSLLYHTGFDLGLTLAQMPNWTATGSVIGTGIGRTGAALRGTGANNFGQYALGAGAASTLIIGCAVYPQSAAASSSNGANFLQFLGDGATTDHCKIRVNTDGSIDAARGTTQIIAPSAPGLFTMDTYDFWEVRVTLHDTTGAIEVRKNGVVVLSGTGLDTKNGGTGSVIDSVRFLTAAGLIFRYDDIYICDTAGSVSNDFLGDCKTTVLLPANDTALEEWDLSTGTNSAALIDEATPNGDTDYIQSDVAGEKTQVTLADLSDTDHEVYGVTLTSWARKDDAGEALFRHGIHSDTTDGNGADHALSTSYVAYQDLFELDPDGDVPWTPVSVNDAEVFVEVRT